MRSVLGWSVLTIAMLFATMSASNRANAGVGLNLVLDTTTKTLWFDGSDSGTLARDSLISRVAWGDANFGVGTSLDASTALNYSWTGGEPFQSLFYIAFKDPGLFFWGGGFFEDSPSDDNWNFTGKGSSAAISYAGLSSAFQSHLESLATSNTQLSVTVGTAGNSLKTSLYSSGGSGGGGGEVPEPTSMAIFGLGALGFAYQARRKSKA